MVVSPNDNIEIDSHCTVPTKNCYAPGPTVCAPDIQNLDTPACMVNIRIIGTLHLHTIADT